MQLLNQISYYLRPPQLPEMDKISLFLLPKTLDDDLDAFASASYQSQCDQELDDFFSRLPHHLQDYRETVPYTPLEKIPEGKRVVRADGDGIDLRVGYRPIGQILYSSEGEHRVIVAPQFTVTHTPRNRKETTRLIEAALEQFNIQQYSDEDETLMVFGSNKGEQVVEGLGFLRLYLPQGREVNGRVVSPMGYGMATYKL